jgi:RNase H-fold protein (predicted Holliday junction resolvase)
MAATVQSSDLNNPSQSQQNLQPNQQPGNQSNSVSPIGSQVNQSQSSAYNPNKQQGTGYTNISQIVAANQGNQLGQTIGSDIQQSGQQAQQQVGQAQQQFNQQTAANQANTAQNAQLVQNVLNNPTQYSGASGTQGQQANQFQQLMSGAYQGPTGLNNASQLQANAANVGQMGQALNTSGGRAGLLQQFVGNPQYNQGEQTLDATLLGQSNAPQLAAARQQALQLQGQTQNAIAGAAATGQQQAQQAQQFGQAVQNQFGQQVAGINSGLQQQAASAQQQANQQYQQTLQAYQSGNITPQQAALLGITQGQQVTGNELQNINSYIQENPQAATAQNVASAQQYNQLAALQQLAGNAAPQQAQNILQQYAGQSGQAGQFAANPAVQGNSTGFQNANTAQLNAYNQQLAPSQAALAGAQNIENLVQQRQQDFASGNLAGANNINSQLTQQGLTINPNLGSWAQNNLATAWQQGNAALANANAGVGGVQTFNISPQQAALQQIQQGNS